MHGRRQRNLPQMRLPNIMPSSTTINTEFIYRLLIEDMITRKQRNWRLLTQDELSTILPARLLAEDIKHDMLCIGNEYLEVNNYIVWTEHSAHAIGIHKEKFPEAVHILEMFEGSAIIAGGSVCRSLYNDVGGSDCDIFFHGNAYRVYSDGETSLTSRIKTVIEKLANLHPDMTVYRTTRAITIVIARVTYQFVLRLYPTLGHIVGGFDIPAAGLLYDGATITGTRVSATCALLGLIVADATRRSTTYENRVMKYYYLMRGLIIFPGLPGANVIMQQMKAQISNELDNYAERNCIRYKLKNSTITDIEREADWETEQQIYIECEKVANKYGYGIVREIRLEPNMLTSGEKSAHADKMQEILDENIISPRYCGYGAHDETCACIRRFDAFGGFFGIYFNHTLDNAKVTILRGNNAIRGNTLNGSDYQDAYSDACNAKLFRTGKLDSVYTYTYGCDIIANGVDIIFAPIVIDHAAHIKAVQHIATVCHPPTASTPCQLKKIFGKHADVVQALTGDINNGPEILQIGEQVRAEVDAAVAQFDNSLQLITENPGRQWTSSCNPVIANPRDWYGPNYRPLMLGDWALERYMWSFRVVDPFRRLPREIFERILLDVLFTDVCPLRKNRICSES
jgi:hypothetical protein